jgi:hypothetical protein
MSRPQRILAAALAVAALVCAVAVIEFALPSPAHASSTQVSMLLDDDQLIYVSPEHMVATLDTLHSLGVDVVKVSLVWQLIAPDQGSTRRPRFDATNPAAYPPGAWSRWDLLVETAQKLGMKVYFLVIGPAPRWAVPKANRTSHQGPSLGWAPQPSEYRQFLEAAGRRYSGSYTPPGPPPGGPYTDPLQGKPIPRVSYWGVWNEPNEISWLTPWYHRAPGGTVLTQPELYRGLVDAAWSGLRATGHSRDTIMVGETANRGLMDPERFVRALYCVDPNLRPLRGHAAYSLGCPSSGSRAAFVRANPGLFRGAFAHHPYGFQTAPNRPAPDKTFVTLDNVPSFERMLNRIFAAYGRHRPGGVPLYLTEWGYKTNPPNPYVPTSPALQATWLNQGEYMMWREPYVKGLTQFLLVDSPPKPGTRRNSPLYWSTFQTGLEYSNGAHKPSFAAYQIPIWLPKPRHGGHVALWGQLRVADHASTQSGQVEFEPRGAPTWQPLAQVSTTSPEGFVFTHVSIPAAGSVRLTWTAPDGTVYASRSVPVS